MRTMFSFFMLYIYYIRKGDKMGFEVLKKYYKNGGCTKEQMECAINILTKVKKYEDVFKKHATGQINDEEAMFYICCLNGTIKELQVRQMLGALNDM